MKLAQRVAAFLLVVAGTAVIYWPAALIVAGVYLAFDLLTD